MGLVCIPGPASDGRTGAGTPRQRSRPGEPWPSASPLAQAKLKEQFTQLHEAFTPCRVRSGDWNFPALDLPAARCGHLRLLLRPEPEPGRGPFGDGAHPWGVRVRNSPRAGPRPNRSSLRGAHAEHHALSDRGTGAAGAHPVRADEGVLDCHRRAGGERGDCLRARPRAAGNRGHPRPGGAGGAGQPRPGVPDVD